MKILITGANGQLGNELSAMLDKGGCVLGPLPDAYKGCEVLCTDLPDTDIADETCVQALLRDFRPDLVFNCAAMTKVDLCESMEEDAWRANATGPMLLARACAQHGARLLHVSTDYVFSGDGDRPYVETDACDPRTAYGRSKLAGEIAVLEDCPDSCVCRTAWLYGMVGGNFVKTMMRLAKERGTVTVVDDQVGNPTCATDLAYQMCLLGASKETGVFHCTCDGDPVSWCTFARKIIELAHIDARVLPCTTEQYPTPAKRPAYSALLNRRLEETVGDHMRDWDQALTSWMEGYLETEGGRT